ENYFAETEQIAFGTGVLVDGLDFSDDKMLQGRTLSYSDTQRYRVGPNYLQLPINAPKKHVATNQRDGQMTVRVDLAPGANPHVNYEPSSLGGLQESAPSGAPHTPFVQGNLVRQTIDRTNDFGQAGQTYRDFSDAERDELIANLLANLGGAADHVKARMVWLFSQCDANYGQRVAEGLGISVPTSDPYGGSVAGVDRRPNQGANSDGQPATGGAEVAEREGQTAQPY
ncbi:catalase, partial [bacterium]